MAYWWVSQNKTYFQERDGGYLWAPLTNKRGHDMYHWVSMEAVSPGDVVFSYFRTKLVSIGLARSTFYRSQRPEEFTDLDAWEEEGRRVDLDYAELENPIDIPRVSSELLELLPEQYGPLQKDGGGKQGYLFSLTDQAGEFLVALAGGTEDHPEGHEYIEAAIKKDPSISKTERVALVKARIGQGLFRDRLLERWHGRCAVTGIDIPETLRASHIKPWSSSNNQERIDPNNGLLLAAHLDALFDTGLITFDDQGLIQLSRRIDKTQLERLGISATASLSAVWEELKRYLGYHRIYRFADSSFRA